MYFDALFGPTGVVLFNGTTEETKKFIRENCSVLSDDCYVIDGLDLKTRRLKDYDAGWEV